MLLRQLLAQLLKSSQRHKNNRLAYIEGLAQIDTKLCRSEQALLLGGLSKIWLTSPIQPAKSSQSALRRACVSWFLFDGFGLFSWRFRDEESDHNI